MWNKGGNTFCINMAAYQNIDHRLGQWRGTDGIYDPQTHGIGGTTRILVVFVHGRQLFTTRTQFAADNCLPRKQLFAMRTTSVKQENQSNKKIKFTPLYIDKEFHI